MCVAAAKTAIQGVQFLRVSSGRTGSLLWEAHAGQAIFRPKSLLNSYIFSFGREKAEKGPAMAEEKSLQIASSNQSFCVIQNAHLIQIKKWNSFWGWFPWAGVGIVILAVAVRAVALDRPLLGNFATKNVVLAMIARNWAEGRSPWWYPTVDVLVEGQRGLHLLELPMGAYVVGGVWRALGGALEVWGRVCSVAFYGAAVAVFFLWVRTLHGERTARGAAMMLALSPVGIIYGQSFMLDASLVFFTVLGLASLDAYLRQGGRLWWGLATGSFALLIVSKLYLAVWLIPGAWMIFWSGSANRVRKVWAFLGLGLALGPGAAWYAHVVQTTAPENPLALHVFDSLRKSMEVYGVPDPLLGSPELYRQILDDLAGVVLTPLGFGLMLLGMVQGGCRRYGVWLLAVAVLVLGLPRKFFEMNYYWVATLPAWCVLVGLGWEHLVERLRIGRGARAVCWLLIGVFAIRYAFKPAFVTPEEDRAVPEAGAIVQSLTELEEPVVTMHGSTIDLLYYCRRPGWAFWPEDPQLADRLRQCQRQGARWAVVVGRDGLAESLGPHSPPLHRQTPNYRLYQMDHWPSNP